LQNRPENKLGEDVTRDLKNWLEKDGEDFLKAIGVKKGQVVLDFGCGEGHYSIPAAKVVGEKGRIYALDKDRQAIDQLAKLMKKNRITNIEVIKRESKTSLMNDSVDFILCYDVVHYLKDRAPVYSELYRVLKPKGIFSLYPKHHKNDSPLMELAQMKLEDIIREVEEAGFSLQGRLLKSLIHDDYYDEGYILHFRKD
jgi:ubiquinone/menaquinone biosynthesis C-methylase UbiE